MEASEQTKQWWKDQGVCEQPQLGTDVCGDDFLQQKTHQFLRFAHLLVMGCLMDMNDHRDSRMSTLCWHFSLSI